MPTVPQTTESCQHIYSLGPECTLNGLECCVLARERHPVEHFVLFDILHFPFAFQIYHSPIHKQAESKSVHHCSHRKHLQFVCQDFCYCVCLYLLILPSIHLYFFAFTVELNEIGFKFVRKCINYIETNGKKTWLETSVHFCSFSCGGRSRVTDFAFDATPAKEGVLREKKKRGKHPCCTTRVALRSALDGNRC